MEAIRQSQVDDIKKLKVDLKVVEEEMRVADKSRAKAIALKVVKDFWTFLSFLAERVIATTKVVEDFRASTEFEDEKANFMVAT